MKPFFYLALIAVIAGCCKAECLAPELTVEFRSFKARDTDTLLLIRYNAGTGFTQPADSTWEYNPVPVTDTSFSNVVQWLNAYDNWKIVLPSLNKEYLFSNMETKNFNCCGERAKRVVSFIQNGQKLEGNLFKAY